MTLELRPKWWEKADYERVQRKDFWAEGGTVGTKA